MNTEKLLQISSIFNVDPATLEREFNKDHVKRAGEHAYDSILMTALDLPRHICEQQGLSTNFNFGKQPGKRAQRGNCYAYALNLTEGYQTDATPGQLNTPYFQQDPFNLGRPNLESHSPNYIHNQLLKDGLVPIQKHGVSYIKQQVIACFTTGDDVPNEHVCNNTKDFHFYRMDLSGCWSHKIAYCPVENTDGDGFIEDPEKTNRRIYRLLVGYYTVPEQGIEYLPA